MAKRNVEGEIVRYFTEESGEKRAVMFNIVRGLMRVKKTVPVPSPRKRKKREVKKPDGEKQIVIEGA